MRLTQEGNLGVGHPPAITASPPWTMRNLFRLGLVTVMAAVMLAFVGVGQARADTIDVCKTGSPNAPCDFETIQAAVNAADPGDTIDVKAGEYNETVAVNKTDLTINGAQAGVDARNRSGNESVVDSSSVSGFAPTFYVTAGGVTIDGFTIQGAADDPGILTDRNASGYTIVNNIVQNNTIGIRERVGG